MKKLIKVTILVLTAYPAAFSTLMGLYGLLKDHSLLGLPFLLCGYLWIDYALRITNEP